MSLKILVNSAILYLMSGCYKSELIKETQTFPTTEIALLLPLESQSNQTNYLANDFMNSARLAVKDLEIFNLNLSIYPTSGEESRAKQAAKVAVEKGAHIIVGPLFSRETTAVRLTLKNKNIKIISLSNDPKVAGETVFILGTTLKSTSDRLVKFAKSKGHERLAIIGPKGAVGLNGILATQAAIRRNGAFLTNSSSYPLHIKGIRESAPIIYNELINSDTTAIIFTDSPTRGLGFISEQLLQLYSDDNKKPPQFMGITRWDNSKEILNEASLNEGWFVVPDQRLKQRFKKKFNDTFGYLPKEISSLSYDAIALIGAIVQKGQLTTLNDKFQREYFLDPNGFMGVNGIFRFKTNGDNERMLSIAEVRSGEYQIIDPAKSKF